MFCRADQEHLELMGNFAAKLLSKFSERLSSSSAA